MTFVIPRQTSKEEVLRRLGWADVGLKDSRLFWGRWDTSARRRAWVMIFPQSGETSGARLWDSHNILIEFDETGVVVSARKVDDKSLTSEFVSWARSQGKDHPHSDLPAQTTFFATFLKAKAVFHFPAQGRVSVQHAGLECIEYDTSVRFRVARDRITIIALNAIPLINRTDNPLAIPRIELALALRDKTPWGKKVTVSIDPASLMPVIRALVRENP